jgi:hypothetical protein
VEDRKDKGVWARKALLGLLLFTVGISTGRAMDGEEDRQYGAGGWGSRKILATGAVGGMLAGSLVSSYFDWWKGSGEPFHFVREGFWNDYSLGIDKIGHAYTSCFYFHAFRDLMLWGGYSEEEAFWWSAGTTAFFAVSIEIGDSFSPYGFSWEDLTGNMLGLGYGMVQTKVPFLQNISFKWSYIPTDGWRWPPHFTDHYDAHTYWLAFNMHRLLPGGVGKSWPEFLQLAVGYSVDAHQTRREVVFGLDFNLEAFRVDSPDLLLLERIANNIHLPGPAVKFTQDRVPQWYLAHLH